MLIRSNIVRPLLLFVLMGSFCWGQSTSQDLIIRIQQLDASLRGNVSGTARSELLAQRDNALYELIAVDPAVALLMAAPAGPRGAVETEWTGSLALLVVDSFESERSVNVYRLLQGAQDSELYFSAEAPTESLPDVTVQGLKVRDRIAVASLSARAAGPTSCSTTGPQQTAVIMVTFDDQPVFPSGFTNSYLTQRFFAEPGGVSPFVSADQFMRENSYGQMSLTGRVFGPYSLPGNLPASCDSSAMVYSAIAAAGAEANLESYSRYIVTFPATSCVRGGASIAGVGTIGCTTFEAPPVGLTTSSVSWVPIFANYVEGSEAPAYFHEYGHNLGMGHARSEDHGFEPLGGIGRMGTRSEYGDPFDVMGLNPGQLSAPHRSMDTGWLRSSESAIATAPGTYNLLPVEQNSGLRGLRILRDATTNSWLWAEYREGKGEFDEFLKGIPTVNVFKGVSIRHEAPAVSASSASDAALLDFHPFTSTFLDAAMLPGETWSDPYSPLDIAVNAVSPTQATVTVNYAATCAAMRVTPESLVADAGTGEVIVTAPPSCQWTAVSAADWITLTGATSGQGDGTVPFSAALNLSFSPRLGSIVIDRQSARIVQQGLSGVAPTSLSPNQGSGKDQIFTLKLNHTVASTAVLLEFSNGGQGGCKMLLSNGIVSVEPVNSFIMLGSADMVGTACTVLAEGSSFNATATESIYQMHISFHASMSGTYRIWARPGPSTSALSSTRYAMGHWEMPACSASPAESALTIPGTGGTVPAGVSADPGCRWTAIGQSPWLHTASGGVASGQLELTVEANPSVKPRSGGVRVGESTIAVNQEGAAPAFSFAPLTRTVFFQGGPGEVRLNGTLDAPRTVTSDAPWLVVTSPAAGEGPGNVSYRIDANPGAANRSATLKAGNAVFTITQLGTASVAITSVKTVGGVGEISPNAWIQVNGQLIVPSNTAAAGKDWSAAPEFGQGRMPTKLDGIEVTINGKPGYIYFFCSAVTSTICAEDQLNVLAPLDYKGGPVEVVVINNGVPSAPFVVDQKPRTPALLQFDAAKHVVAVHADGRLIGPTSLYPNLSTPADWAEPIILFGVGWGVGSTALVEGSPTQSGTFPNTTCTVGGQNVPIAFAGLISPGLVQINLTTPIFVTGELPVRCRFDGYSTEVEALLTFF